MPSLPPLPIQLHSVSKLSMMKMGAAVAVATTFTTRSTDMEEPRIGVMVIILFVSLFAASFPTLSKQIPFLRIPGILFFIGKHFGTGVILATAFIHLLDDAFRSLQDPTVEERYGRVGRWAGLIILVSLLSIFLVEYVSTAYVEHLQEKPSAPPTPVNSRPPSRHTSPHAKPPHILRPSQAPLSETTPLLSVPEGPPPSLLPRAPSGSILAIPAPTRTQSHPLPHPHTQAPLIPGLSIEVLTNSPRICRMSLKHDHGRHLIQGKKGETHPEEEDEYEGERRREDEREEEREQKPRIGRRRQVVGLLVLQLGIMIHSFVIGLTLSITSGSDFTSLTTAIIFHQLFEGLSLGIRIASLPPKPKDTSEHEHEHEQLNVDEVQHRLEEEYDPEDPEGLQEMGTENGGRATPSCSHAIECAKSKSGSKARVHSHSHSDSPRRWTLKSFSLRNCTWRNLKEVEWLKPTLTLLFGVTTPVGMGLGMLMWNGSGRKHAGNDASILLTQGIMSAISAGMLIYAATVEMIAGDFVFGDVEGHHHHHHHAHEHGHGGATVDDEAQDESSDVGREDSEIEGAGVGEGEKTGTPVGKRVLAVLSLFAGVGAMVLVGLGE